MHPNSDRLADVEGKIYFGLGYSCNNDCMLCVADSRNNPAGDLPTRDILDYINRLKCSKRVFLEISGGEPTIRKDFFHIMQAINDAGIGSVLFSNGRLFSNRSFCERYYDCAAQCTLIPIHSDNANEHDFQTQVKGSFNETVEGIKNLFEYGLPVAIKTIVTRLNYKKLPDIVRFCAESFPESTHFGIDALDILGSADRNKGLLSVKLKESVPYIEKAIDVAVELGIRPSVLFVPLCVVKEEYRKYIGLNEGLAMYKAPRIESLEVTLTRGPISKCAGCKYVQRCPGTWHSYFNNHGTDEIEPIA